MALKGLFKRMQGRGREPWCPSSGPYPRLTTLDESALSDLVGKGGVFVLWHRGVRPQWLYVGAADDLAVALKASREDGDVKLYDLNEGVYVAWALVPVEGRSGVVAGLRAALSPAIGISPLNALGVIDPEAPLISFAPPED